jgi:hypothetical protein
MEIKLRMSKRLGWLLGVVVLISIGLLVACGTTYNSSSDGLVIVGSQGSGLIETFSFNLGSGSATAVGNTPTDTISKLCVLNGLPSSLVLDPAGAYAYTIINANSSCNTATAPSATGLLVLKVNSDGTTTAAGNLISFQPVRITIQGTVSMESVPVVPSTMVMDAAGKFLFVADRATTDTAGLNVPGAVSVFSLGSGGAATEVAGSPFVPSTAPSTLQQAGLDIVDVAPTPTVFPPIGINGVQNSVCSAAGLNPPTSQYLYAVDGLGNQVFEFGVNTTSGVLTLSLSPTVGIPTDAIPAGVAVDPCDRFVYVTGSQNARVSAYTICNGSATQSTQCPLIPDWSLQPVAGSPFSLTGSANRPGPLVVDPFGNFVYVLSTNSNTISPLRISPVSGALAGLSPATVATGSAPKSIVIRGDDNWMFVTNFNSPSSISQYAITPASGALTAQPNIPTDNYPWGVAVK